MAQYVLGIDNGSMVSKAGLFALDGTEVAVAAPITDKAVPTESVKSTVITEV